MGKVAVGVGQHHFIRSYLPALVAVLLSSALLLVGAGFIVERNTERFARGLAQRGSPGQQVSMELGQAVGELAVDSMLAHETGDERRVDEALSRLDAAASSYDGWVHAAQLQGVVPVTDAVKKYEERIAVGTSDRIKADEVEDALDQMQHVISSNHRARIADMARMLDGIAASQERRRWLEISVMGILACGCLALMIAARRREERVCDDEKNAVRTLEQTNADLEAFAGRVAHDLRNPLVPILSGTQVIERSVEEPAVRRAAERIERSAKRIATMIDMLLDFSKMSTADRPNATELAPVVEEVVDAFREKAAAHGVSIEVAVEEGLRVAAEPIVVASPLQNLIENAFKYGRCPDKAPVIDVRAFSRAGMAIVEVEDRGPGITPAEAETLFRAFARGRDGGEGVGLGLATAKRLVEARGGSLGLRVGQYGGALFQIRLPAAYAADHGERREALSGPQV